MLEVATAKDFCGGILPMEDSTHSFFYGNSLLYIGLLVGACGAWFAAVALVETALYAAARIPPRWVIPVVFLGGLLLVYGLCRTRLYRLYTLAGKGVLYQDRVEIVLRFKTYRIPYGEIRRLRYQEKHTRGIILGAKGLSLFLEEPLRSSAAEQGERELLKAFFDALEQRAQKGGA